MKTLLLALAFMFSISLSHADEGDNKRKRHNNVPKGKITYSEHKKKKSFAKKKKMPKKFMFAGEGIRPRANKR